MKYQLDKRQSLYSKHWGGTHIVIDQRKFFHICSWVPVSYNYLIDLLAWFIKTLDWLAVVLVVVLIPSYNIVKYSNNDNF